MRTPHGLEQIIETFGDPRKYVLPDGTLAPAWERDHIVRIDLPAPLRLDLLPGNDEPMISKITANKVIADRIREALEMVYERGYWEGLGGYSGGFNWRMERKSNRKLSTHAWGIAWDFSATKYPQGLKPDAPEHTFPVEIVRILRSYGFIWGGDWNNVDQMHFQFATGY